MTPEITDLAASVHQRLLNRSKALDLDFNLLLARYAIERFLYRLAQSPYADQFVLKGAMLLQIWLPEAGRPTRDLDLLGFGDMTPDRCAGFSLPSATNLCLLTAAIHDTFERRSTAIPSGPPVALTPAFGQNPDKARQWRAFLAKSRIGSVTEDFATVIRFNAVFLGPVLDAARAGSAFRMTWPRGGPWQPEQSG